MRPGTCSRSVTEEVGRHLEADTAVTVRYDGPGSATFVATWTAAHVDPSPFRVGRQILVDGHVWGAFAAGSNSDPFGPEAEVRLSAFAELVAQAIANVDARIKLKESRRGGDAARRRSMG